MRDLLFHRDFRGYSGGHGKVFDYFGHAMAHPATSPRIYLTPQSIPEGNPWLAHAIRTETTWDPDRAGALFLGGMDWTAVPDDRPTRPVINLVQGVRHADAASPLRTFLRRRAVRICVGEPVADAIRSTGEVNGPVFVIPAGIEVPAMQAGMERLAGRVFIGAVKQPAIGRALAHALEAAGRQVDLCIEWLDRPAYLARLAGCERAVLLPLPREGFFLPALEAMALGCAVVVPDCIGNRAYVRPGTNALSPAMDVAELVSAVEALDDDALRGALTGGGRLTAAGFQPGSERAAFHRILDDLDGLWRT